MNYMSRKEFNEMTHITFKQLTELSEGKGAEYAGQEVSHNEHANFDRLSTKLQIPPEKVLWVYLTKHLDSIENYINTQDQPAVKLSEPITGRIDDAILYLLLLKGMVIRGHNSSELCKVADEADRRLRAGYPEPFYGTTAVPRPGLGGDR